MTNSRRIQNEIDRLLKKTSEGIEEYEALYDKFENAPSPNAKERLEADLKKEIKKLQRHRDQIKAYITNDDVKDTKQLELFRKRIEEKMEAFKVCEREMKTKAFSKEGLAVAASELYESPLALMENFLKGIIEEGRKRAEVLEYDVQRSLPTRAGRKNKQPQKSDAHVKLEKLQIHIFKWHALLRMLTNEEVEPKEIEDMRKEIEDVVKEDADVETMSDMSMYEMFDIPDPKPKSATTAEEEINTSNNSNSNANTAAAAAAAAAIISSSQPPQASSVPNTTIPISPSSSVLAQPSSSLPPPPPLPPSHSAHSTNTTSSESNNTSTVPVPVPPPPPPFSSVQPSIPPPPNYSSASISFHASEEKRPNSYSANTNTSTSSINNNNNNNNNNTNNNSLTNKLLGKWATPGLVAGKKLSLSHSDDNNNSADSTTPTTLGNNTNNTLPLLGENKFSPASLSAFPQLPNSSNTTTTSALSPSSFSSPSQSSHHNSPPSSASLLRMGNKLSTELGQGSRSNSINKQSNHEGHHTNETSNVMTSGNLIHGNGMTFAAALTAGLTLNQTNNLTRVKGTASPSSLSAMLSNSTTNNKTNASEGAASRDRSPASSAVHSQPMDWTGLKKINESSLSETVPESDNDNTSGIDSSGMNVNTTTTSSKKKENNKNENSASSNNDTKRKNSAHQTKEDHSSFKEDHNNNDAISNSMMTMEEMDAMNEDTFGDDAILNAKKFTGSLADLASATHMLNSEWQGHSASNNLNNLLRKDVLFSSTPLEEEEQQQEQEQSLHKVDVEHDENEKKKSNKGKFASIASLTNAIPQSLTQELQQLQLLSQIPHPMQSGVNSRLRTPSQLVSSMSTPHNMHHDDHEPNDIDPQALAALESADNDAHDDETFGDEAIESAIHQPSSLAELASVTNKMNTDWQKGSEGNSPNGANAASAYIFSALKRPEVTDHASLTQSIGSGNGMSAISRNNKNMANQTNASSLHDPYTSPTSMSQLKMLSTPSNEQQRQQQQREDHVESVAPAMNVATLLANNTTSNMNNPNLATNIHQGNMPSTVLSSSSSLSLSAAMMTNHDASPNHTLPHNAPTSTMLSNTLHATHSSLPDASSDVAKSMNAVQSSPKSKSTEQNVVDLHTTLHMLDMSMSNLVGGRDVQLQLINPAPNPVKPLPYIKNEVHLEFYSQSIFKKFNDETLFFIFYCQQKYMWYRFALRELISRNYVFHTERKEWFKKLDDSQAATAATATAAPLNQPASYKYFDWKSSWGFKEERDFLFESKFVGEMPSEEW